MKFAILVLEKNSRDRKQIEAYLRKLSHEIHLVDPADLEKASSDIDIVMAGLSGKDISEEKLLKAELARVRSLNPQTQVILCAPGGSKNLDKLSLELQARAFLLKPLDIDNFIALLEKTLAVLSKRRVREQYRKGTKKISHITEIIGCSDKMMNVMALLEKVSTSRDTSVLLLGESGTGKSLFAQAIHEMSDRSSGPFIEINCAAIPSNLLESELFGYEPGAFTDAKREKMGLLELADDGTLFLDEITEVDIQTQAKLLKFLDTKKIRRLGGGIDIKVDVRIVVASNRDLKEEVRAKTFREDLFYRLNVVEIIVPPLRERREDIESITSYYMNEYKKKFNKSDLTLTEQALEALCNYNWPGNVRELINILERAVLLARGDQIDKEDLLIQRNTVSRHLSIEGQKGELIVKLPSGGVHLEDLEKKVIEETLKQTRGNVLKASRMLGLSRGALRYKIMKYNISSRSFYKKHHEPAEIMH